MNIKQQLPELNDNQWKMLERAILECLPSYRFSPDGFEHSELDEGFNDCIDQATANIKQMMGQG